MPSLADLIRMGKQYVKDAMPGGLLNPEVNRQGILDGAALSTTAVPVLGDLLGLGADVNRYVNEPESRTAGNFALSGLGMLPFVPAMTAWHGSPHKFDKFDLSKIGTGEGAQAYGHGLYLAESPEVARMYQTAGQRPHDYALEATRAKPEPRDAAHLLLNEAKKVKRGEPSSLNEVNTSLLFSSPDAVSNALAKQAIIMRNKKANLYKTDIPDEAVARFLDWDKPLSQQAPEVQDAIKNTRLSEFHGRAFPSDKGLRELTLGEAYNRLDNGADIADSFKQQGIPGIRYLDGGSRSSGQGSSNFVAFDPEMIRILERNGQPTGLEPWKPGEYRLKDLIGKE